jgi:hypothetical protein
MLLESRMLRKIFGYHREEVTGDWKRLHDKKLHVYIFLMHSAVLFIDIND